MSTKIAGVDLFNQGLNNEYRITILEKVIDKILAKNDALISQNEIEEIRTDVVKILQQKYPEAGIEPIGEHK